MYQKYFTRLNIIPLRKSSNSAKDIETFLLGNRSRCLTISVFHEHGSFHGSRRTLYLIFYSMLYIAC